MIHMKRVLCALVVASASHLSALAQTDADIIPSPVHHAIVRSAQLNAPASSGHPHGMPMLSANFGPDNSGHGNFAPDASGHGNFAPDASGHGNFGPDNSGHPHILPDSSGHPHDMPDSSGHPH